MTMTRLNTPARIEANDRRLSAIHEAGHAVMAEHIGETVSFAHIFRNAGVEPGDTFMRSWGGRAGASVGRSPFSKFNERPTAKARKVAVAGGIAELAWRRWREERFEDLDLGTIAEEELGGGMDFMSASDWQLAGEEPGDEPSDALWRDFQRVAKLLRPGGKLWLPLLRYARKLIVLSREGAGVGLTSTGE